MWLRDSKQVFNFSMATGPKSSVYCALIPDLWSAVWCSSTLCFLLIHNHEYLSLGFQHPSLIGKLCFGLCFKKCYVQKQPYFLSHSYIINLVEHFLCIQVEFVGHSYWWIYHYLPNLTCCFSFCSSADEKFRWNTQGRVGMFLATLNNKSVYPTLYFCLIFWYAIIEFCTPSLVKSYL